MNFHELTPIETERVDPLTGNTYTFRAAPPIDLTLLTLNPELSFPDFLITFCWRVLAGGWDKEMFPDLTGQVIDVLPILLTVAENIQVKIDGDSEFINIHESQSISLFIKEGINSRWEGVTPAPSKDLLSALNDEVLHSAPVMLATKYYLNRVFNEVVEEIEKKNDNEVADNNMDTQPHQETQQGFIHYSLHAVGQQFNPMPPDLSITPQAVTKDWQHRTGESVDHSILKFGMNLTEIKSRVMDGLMRKLTETNYKGNVEPISQKDILARLPGIKDEGEIPKALRHVTSIPRLQIGKRELVKLSGMDYYSQGDVERVVQALRDLATEQYCFYYSRLVYGPDGKPKMDKSGKYEKEDVYAVSTLFELKIINDPDTQKLKYYEIQPGPIFLDQKESYFMLIPANWRKEVESQIGNKKTSKYVYLFLTYLRYQFEQKRRLNSNKSKGRTSKPKQDYQIKCNWIVIAKAIGMPESVYKGQKARAVIQMQEAYTIATQLGYLSTFTRDGEIDTLVLDPNKYHQTRDDINGLIGTA